jgi:hypothetical protein
MTMRSFSAGLWLLPITIGLATPSLMFSQAMSGTVIGTVLDPTGAVVPNAGITISDTARGVSFKTTSNESGNYTLTQLTPGTIRSRRSTLDFRR